MKLKILTKLQITNTEVLRQISVCKNIQIPIDYNWKIL